MRIGSEVVVDEMEVGAAGVPLALVLVGSPSCPERLSDAEREILDRFSREKRREEWLAGRRAAKYLLAHHLGAGAPPASRIQVLPDEDRHPVASIVDERGGARPLPVCLSISHRGGAAGAALLDATTGRVGIDIELMEPRSELIAEDYFTARERRMLARLDDGIARHGIALLWSLKEAALKAAGVGLSVPTNDVELRELEAGGMAGSMSVRGEAGSVLRAERFPAPRPGVWRAALGVRLADPYIVSVAVIRRI
jgi:4'-phosphopantetheinyl transferase